MWKRLVGWALVVPAALVLAIATVMLLLESDRIARIGAAMYGLAALFCLSLGTLTLASRDSSLGKAAKWFVIIVGVLLLLLAIGFAFPGPIGYLFARVDIWLHGS